VSYAISRDGGELRAAASLDRLHPTAVTDSDTIEHILDKVQRDRVVMWRGMNRRIDRETATIAEATGDALVLQTRNFDPRERDAIFLNFALDQQPYFFAAPFEADLGKGRIRVGRPASIYRAERRSRIRRPPGEGDPRRVALLGESSPAVQAEVEDTSPEGLCVRLPDAELQALDAMGEQVQVRLLDGSAPGSVLHGEVRNRAPVPERRGWTRIGLDVSTSPRARGLTIERRDRVLTTTAGQRVQRRWKVAAAGLRVATDRALSALGRHTRLPSVRIVDYENDQGETLRGIVDSWGDTRSATAIVIPPAWGRTKETLMPLAATLVASFRAAREPVVVLRFDGIRKRGESYNDPECREPGKEHHRFTFSQGVRDIIATLDFLERSPEYGPRKMLLVSFSAASIESRRAVATDSRIDGWVCVVGAADTQSMMKVISGGVDYVAGVERGVPFGLQEVLGIEVDIDHAGEDLFLTSLPFLSDSRRDFSRIVVPVTWIHGIHDAWMDGARARDVLSRGNAGNRRFIEVPTGHMLKSSREALETFQLIAQETSRMALGTTCPLVLPDLRRLARRQRAERRRLPEPAEVDLRSFWKDYLVGRDESLGIELMTHTSPYEELMGKQAEALDLKPDQIVIDLGSGTGAFPLFLARAPAIAGVRVVEIDYVRAGLERARYRLEHSPDIRTAFVESNLEVLDGRSIPIASRSVDRVLAGFFLSYIEDPVAALREIHRLIKPGGRLVLSSLRRDADISKLYTEGIVELRQKIGSLGMNEAELERFESAARNYLNQASRLLDLEETGRFHFWDSRELRRLVRDAGFEVVECVPVFGSPPQAILVAAVRR
jgi:ubiquinone/menaquinone biosynthesis C-methylase UbiE